MVPREEWGLVEVNNMVRRKIDIPGIDLESLKHMRPEELAKSCLDFQDFDALRGLLFTWGTFLATEIDEAECPALAGYLSQILASMNEESLRALVKQQSCKVEDIDAHHGKMGDKVNMWIERLAVYVAGDSSTVQ